VGPIQIGSRSCGAAVTGRRPLGGNYPNILISARARLQPPTSPSMMSPNRSQVSPLNLIICTCEIGAKLVGDVLILMPGKRPLARDP